MAPPHAIRDRPRSPPALNPAVAETPGRRRPERTPQTVPVPTHPVARTGDTLPPRAVFGDSGLFPCSTTSWARPGRSRRPWHGPCFESGTENQHLPNAVPLYRGGAADRSRRQGHRSGRAVRRLRPEPAEGGNQPERPGGGETGPGDRFIHAGQRRGNLKVPAPGAEAGRGVPIKTCRKKKFSPL